MRTKKYLSPNFIAEIGLIILLGIQPIFMTNKYYNILASKYVLFCFTSIFCLALCIIISVIKTDFSNPRAIVNKAKEQITSPDIVMMLFAVVSTVSCLNSDYFLAALGGGQGRKMGLVMNLCITFAYFFIVKYYKIKARTFYLISISLIIVCALAAVQFVGYDPFGLIATLTSVRKKTFLSLIGNINVYSSYICLIAPFAMYMFCFTQEKFKSVFWCIISCFGYIGLFTANSDSGYLGMAAAFILLFLLSTKSENSFNRIWILILNFFIVAGIFRFITISYQDTLHPVTFLTRIVISNPVVIGGFFASSVIIYIMRLFKPNKTILKKIRLIFLGLFAIFATAIVILFICFSFFDTETPLGSFENYLRFSKNWGTGRGDIWLKAFKTFSELPLDKKLFGAGEDTFALVLSDHLGYSEILNGNSYYDNAHNEFIHYLLTIGIFGVTLYVMLAFYAIKTAVKSDNIIKNALLIPIVAFLFQSTVNILQPITSPLVYVLFALTQCNLCTETKKKS